METNNQIISLNNCIGKEVLDITGNKCGTIKDFLINYESFNVPFVMISDGEFLKNKYMVAPISELRLENPDAPQYFLKVSQRKLQRAPQLPKNMQGDEDTLLDEINAYYGIEKHFMREGKISKDGYEHQSYQGSSQITDDVPTDNQQIKDEVDYNKIKGNDSKT